MKQKFRTRIIFFVFLNLFFTIRIAAQEFTSITVDNIAGAGQYSSIAVDLESKPHISYYYGANSNNLKYARFDDGIWKIETVDIPGDVGKNTSIVTDIINKPSISYFYDGNNFLKLAYKESVNSPFDMITGPSADMASCKSTSIVLEHMAYCPITAYFDNNDQNLKLAIFENSSDYIPIDPYGRGWMTEIVCSSDRWMEDISLALDNGNEPHIAYIDVAGTTAILKYATKNCVGSGCLTQVSINQPTGDGKWNFETVDGSGNAGEFVSLSVGTDNIPQICYYDKNGGHLKYAKRSSTGWSIEIVDNSGDVGRYNSLDLDEFNNPHISYYDAENGNLKYAFKTEGLWNIRIVDEPGDVGRFSSIAVDKSNNPHFSYFDATNQHLKYACKKSSDRTKGLFGIIMDPPNSGYLVKINGQNGDANLLGNNTGINSPCVLEYILETDKFLSSNGSGYPSLGYFIDPDDGTSSMEWSQFNYKDELDYFSRENALYSVNNGSPTSLFYRLNAETGESGECIGIINKGPIHGLDTDPISKILYGVGRKNNQDEWLFTVSRNASSSYLETDIAIVNSQLTGIAFDDNGKLYATDGFNLLSINKVTGEVTQIGPFGSDIGFINDITYASPNVDLLPIYPGYWRLELTPTWGPLADLVKDGMPWCPLGFPGCPGGPHSPESGSHGFPEYMGRLSNILERIGNFGTGIQSQERVIMEFRDLIASIPLKINFNKELRDQLLSMIEKQGPEAGKTNLNNFLTSIPLMKVLNAVELDLRLPKLTRQKITGTKLNNFDLGGLVWGGMSNVLKPGEISLNIESDYKVFPNSSKFSPSWPFMTYNLNFDAELGADGFIDLTFYIKELKFKNQVSSIRVLQKVKDGLVDVTTAWDKSAGTVMARTTSPGIFIILGKD